MAAPSRASAARRSSSPTSDNVFGDCSAATGPRLARLALTAPQRRLAECNAAPPRASRGTGSHARRSHWQGAGSRSRPGLRPARPARRAPAASPSGRARPLNLDGLAMGGDFHADNIGPARDQFGGGKSLPGKRLADNLAGDLAQRLGERRDGLSMVRGSVMPASMATTTLAAKSTGRQRAPRPCGCFVTATHCVARLV